MFNVNDLKIVCNDSEGPYGSQKEFVVEMDIDHFIHGFLPGMLPTNAIKDCVPGHSIQSVFDAWMRKLGMRSRKSKLPQPSVN